LSTSSSNLHQKIITVELLRISSNERRVVMKKFWKKLRTISEPKEMLKEKNSRKGPHTNTVRTGSRWIPSKTKDDRLLLILCNGVTESQLLRGLCGILSELKKSLEKV